MHQYGIIGNPLGHSYSEQYFTQLFEQEGLRATYRPYAIEDIDLVRELLQKLTGFNVTYPYKEAIIPHLQYMDEVAATIGAVNVVSRGKGYNTDWQGFKNSILPHLRAGDSHALVLGTGGVSKAVQYALREMGIDYTVVSRQHQAFALQYEELSAALMQQHRVIINCTPLGMLPDVATLPAIPYDMLTEAHLLYDCVYNPACTRFLQEGAKRGARTVNCTNQKFFK